jgi:hypothetical protein
MLFLSAAIAGVLTSRSAAALTLLAENNAANIIKKPIISFCILLPFKLLLISKIATK